MTRMARQRLLRSGNVLLVRAAVFPLASQNIRWPLEDQADDCRRWLREVWANPAFSEATRASTPGLARAVALTLLDTGSSPRKLRKTVAATAGYFLRSAARPAPFGLFAGVAAATAGDCTGTIGTAHTPLARPDTLWLDHVRRRLAARPDVLPHLSFQVDPLAVQHGDVLDRPASGGRMTSVQIRRPLAEVLQLTEVPIVGAEILARLQSMGATSDQATSLLAQALEAGAITSSLSAPMTEPDPLGHMLRLLGPLSDSLKPDAVGILDDLAAVHRMLAQHNAGTPDAARELRQTATAAMTDICDQGRARLSIDTRLDAAVTVPSHVVEEAERAGDALMRLTRNLQEQPMWSAYHAVFWERYGAGSLVPVREAADLAAGVGLPSDFPMSLYRDRPPQVLPRDELLMSMAWNAVMQGADEVRLTDSNIDELCTVDLDDVALVPHMEMAVQVHAETAGAVDRGDFTLSVRPGWSTGTFSGRFAAMLDEDAIGAAYRELPTLVEGALSAQLSFAPPHPHAENVSRIPLLLPYVIPVGEHRVPADNVIPLDDLAVLSTGRRLHLASMSRRRVVEPVVLHPLALEKQAPPLARFVAMIARGTAGAWTHFDWGPLAPGLPYLPRVRYGKSVLSPARWRLTSADLPSTDFTQEWREALAEWTQQWRCARRLELRDDDRYLRLDLGEPVHARLLHTHLQRHGVAELTEAPDDREMGWIGHAHELTMSMVSTRTPLPHPDLTAAPVVHNTALLPPGSVRSRWVQAKIFTHPTAMDQILTARLPGLLGALGDPRCWFTRYRTSQEDDHLRLRFATAPEDYAEVTRALAEWTEQLQADALASRLVLDGYRPELGRYPALEAAEGVFVADSDAVRAVLTDTPRADRLVVCALGMLDTARGLLGNEGGVRWLAATDADTTGRQPVTREVLNEVRKGTPGHRAGWTDRIAATRDLRREALGAYRAQLGSRPLGPVLESLLHMHHNRVMGPDRDAEAASRHVARQACRSLVARGAFDD